MTRKGASWWKNMVLTIALLQLNTKEGMELSITSSPKESARISKDPKRPWLVTLPGEKKTSLQYLDEVMSKEAKWGFEQAATCSITRGHLRSLDFYPQSSNRYLLPPRCQREAEEVAWSTTSTWHSEGASLSSTNAVSEEARLKKIDIRFSVSESNTPNVTDIIKKSHLMPKSRKISTLIREMSRWKN